MAKKPNLQAGFEFDLPPEPVPVIESCEAEAPPMSSDEPEEPDEPEEVIAVTCWYGGYLHVACYTEDGTLVMGRRCSGKGAVASVIKGGLGAGYVWRGKTEHIYEWAKAG